MKKEKKGKVKKEIEKERAGGGRARAGEIRGGDRGWSATRARRLHAAPGGRGVGPRPDSVSVRGFGELGLR
jgi:hypothetical protein